jgi:hypothetical protein
MERGAAAFQANTGRPAPQPARRASASGVRTRRSRNDRGGVLTRQECTRGESANLRRRLTDVVASFLSNALVTNALSVTSLTAMPARRDRNRPRPPAVARRVDRLCRDCP